MTTLSNRGGQVAIDIRRGVTWSRVLTLLDKDNDAIDITGRTYQGAIIDVSSGMVVASIVCVIVDASGGTMMCSLTAAATSVLPIGDEMRYYVQELNGSEVTELLSGGVTIG